MLRAGVAAGHPATVDAGFELLEAGGSAADAAAGACLASCVAETVMTGLLGGGHAIYRDAREESVRTLDFFVAVPGLGAPPRDAELVRLAVPFGTELVHYAIGPASCGVPGVPAGVEALWREYGRLPWPRIVEPALRLARTGVPLPPAHAACLAMLEPVMTMNEGARIYAPGGRLLEAGEALEQPGLARALETLAREGAGTFYGGTLADALLALVDDRGGVVTPADLAAYAARWRDAVAVEYGGAQVLSRESLSGFPHTLGELPPLAGASSAERALALVTALDDADRTGDTTNITVVDAAGSACVLTTSLGLGSGDFLPGYDLHLNSMLGEADLLVAPLQPGARMPSMLAPSIAVDGNGAALAAGAAGGTRLRSALVQVLAGVLDEDLAPQEAVDRPRVHPAAGVVHAEPGVDEDALRALDSAGYEVRRWPQRHHYFGGVSLIARTGAAGDPRRSGSARMLG